MLPLPLLSRFSNSLFNSSTFLTSAMPPQLLTIQNTLRLFSDMNLVNKSFIHLHALTRGRTTNVSLQILFPSTDLFFKNANEPFPSPNMLFINPSTAFSCINLRPSTLNNSVIESVTPAFCITLRHSLFNLNPILCKVGIPKYGDLL